MQSKIYFPYRVHSHFSVLEAYAHIDELVLQAKALGFKALALTDIHTLSGCVQFFRECKKHEIKPILGSTLRLLTPEGEYNYITLLCKNYRGWRDLIKILSLSQLDDNENSFIKLNDLFDEDHKDLIAIIGFQNSIYYPSDVKVAVQVFDNVYYSNEPLSQDKSLFKGLKEIKTVPVYYPTDQDQLYQQILICSKFKITLKRFEELDDYHRKFFEENLYFMQTLEEQETLQEIYNTIESYEISEKPKIPSLSSSSPEDKLKALCRTGWKNKLNSKISLNPELKQTYTERIQEELEVFIEAGLCGYMLVIWDIVQFCRKNNIRVGLRGSAGGCLVSYLIDISDIDPMQPDPTLPYDPAKCLLFSRFYNKARNTEGNISLPDIDLDVEPSYREFIIDYLKKKYGKLNVGKIATFGRMDGRGAIKEVFRVLDPYSNSFDIANEITKHFVNTDKVSDILENLKEDDPKYNIIQYNLEHEKPIADYYKDYKHEFDTAIKMANTIRNQGKHAAGIVITNEDLAKTVPSLLDPKTEEFVVGLEMLEAEYCGAVKYDILGVAALEKVHIIHEMILNNLAETPVTEERIDEE